MVTGAVPIEVKVTVLEAVCPTATLPKAKLFVLTTSDAVLCPNNANGKQKIAIASKAMRPRLSGLSRLEVAESVVARLLTDNEPILFLNSSLSPKDVYTHSALSVPRLISACP